MLTDSTATSGTEHRNRGGKKYTQVKGRGLTVPVLWSKTHYGVRRKFNVLTRYNGNTVFSGIRTKILQNKHKEITMFQVVHCPSQYGHSGLPPMTQDGATFVPLAAKQEVEQTNTQHQMIYVKRSASLLSHPNRPTRHTELCPFTLATKPSALYIITECVRSRSIDLFS